MSYYIFSYLHLIVQNVFPSNFHNLLFNKRCLICPGITYFDFVPICIFCFLLHYISLSDTLIFVIVPNLYKTLCYSYVLCNTSKFSPLLNSDCYVTICNICIDLTVSQKLVFSSQACIYSLYHFLFAGWCTAYCCFFFYCEC